MARWLAARPEVATVLHPALESDPGHAIWKRDFLAPSGLFSVVLKPAPQSAVAAMLDGLELFGMGYSWGGFESLVDPVRLRAPTGPRPMEPAGPALRFHIGLEDVDDLKADLDAGFARLRRRGGLKPSLRGRLRSSSRHAAEGAFRLCELTIRPPFALLLEDQHQIADIDEDRQGLAEDDDAVARAMP